MTNRAALVRSLHAQHPELTPTELARRAGCTRQAAVDALRQDGTRRGGRPSTGAAVVLRERDLEPRVLDAAKREAATDGVALSEVLASACAASLIPEGEWLDGKRRKAKRAALPKEGGPKG